MENQIEEFSRKKVGKDSELETKKVKKFEVPASRQQESQNRKYKNKNGEKEIFEEFMEINFPELKKTNNFKLKGRKELQKEKENPTLKHVRMKFKNTKLKEKILKAL